MKSEMNKSNHFLFKNIFAPLLFLICLEGCTREVLPYDERANARSDLQAALTQAKSKNKLILIVFGANWCPDCRALANQMAKGKLAERVAERFIVVKIDVGNWDKNLDVVYEYGNPIKKGIPAIAVLASDGKLLQSTKAGELASARSMGENSILLVFDKISESSL